MLIEPPFDNPSDPVVRIESPEVNGSYGGVLTVRGIAYDPEIRITRLDLLIDGVARGMIQINQSRPDICGTEELVQGNLAVIVVGVALAGDRHAHAGLLAGE